MNICINARDAMPNGGRLLLETEMVELDEPYCRFYPHASPGGMRSCPCRTPELA